MLLGGAIVSVIFLTAIIFIFLILQFRLPLNSFFVFLALEAVWGCLLYLPLLNLGRRRYKYICNFIARRNISDENWKTLWLSSEKFQIARYINTQCIKYIEWSDETKFLPGDSFSMMLSSKTGDLDDVECVEAIEREFSLKFPQDFFEEETPDELKFKDVVGYVTEHGK